MAPTPEKPPNPAPALRRVRRGLAVVLALVVVAELLARLVTGLSARLALARHPALAERVAAAMWNDVPDPDLVLGPVADAPAPVVSGEGGERRVKWTTWGAFPDDALPSFGPRAEGTTRVAILGHATSADETPQKLQAALDLIRRDSGLPGTHEVVGGGLSSTDLYVTRLLAPRLLAQIDPHVVVVIHGSNDVMRAYARIAALRSRALGFQTGPFPPGSRGLLDLYRERVRLPASDTDPAVAEALADPFAGAEEALWRLSRLAWKSQRRLVVTTYPRPAFERLDPSEFERFDLELRHLYTASGGVTEYAARLDAFNAMVRRFAAGSGTPLVDLSKALEGAGADLLWDHAHPTPAGAERIAAALAPVVASLEPVVGPTTTETGRELRLAPSTRDPAPAGCDPSRCPGASCRTGGTCLDHESLDAALGAACASARACLPLPREPGTRAVVPQPEDAEALCAFVGGRVPTLAELRAGTSVSPAAAADFLWVRDGTDTPQLVRARDLAPVAPESPVLRRRLRCAYDAAPEPAP